MFCLFALNSCLFSTTKLHHWNTDNSLKKQSMPLFSHSCSVLETSHLMQWPIFGSKLCKQWFKRHKHHCFNSMKRNCWHSFTRTNRQSRNTLFDARLSLNKVVLVSSEGVSCISNDHVCCRRDWQLSCFVGLCWQQIVVVFGGELSHGTLIKFALFSSKLTVMRGLLS